jgi:hypothetical protein
MRRIRKETSSRKEKKSRREKYKISETVVLHFHSLLSCGLVESWSWKNKRALECEEELLDYSEDAYEGQQMFRSPKPWGLSVSLSDLGLGTMLYWWLIRSKVAKDLACQMW